MKNIQGKLAGFALLLLCAAAVTTMAQPTRDSLRGLKRAITEANAPTLTVAQETALTTLITAYRDAQPDEPDAALVAARTAFDAAVLAGNTAAMQTQAAAIAARGAVLANAHLQLEGKFEIDALAVLRSGGQFNPLVTKFGNDRVLDLVESLVGRGGFGGPDGGPGGGRGGGRP